MKGINLKIIFYILLSFILLSCNNDNPVNSNTPENNIEIISVTPDTLLPVDSLTEFIVKVKYCLQTADSAVLSMGFNYYDPNNFSMLPYIDSLVYKGSGTLSLIGLVRPKKWGLNIPFIVYVNMAQAPLPSTFIPLADDTKKIFSFK